MRRRATTMFFIPLTLLAAAGCGSGGGAMPSMTPEEMMMAATGSGLACEPTATGEALAGRASPYDSAATMAGETLAKVCYSRPALRGRTMIGGDAVPHGSLWRFGANEPTIIHLDGPAAIAGIPVDPGSYSLYAVPAEAGDWTLIVNRSTSQWGHESQYTEEVEAQEAGRAEVRTETVEESVESFTITTMDGGGGFVAEWQNSRIYVPVTPAS